MQLNSILTLDRTAWRVTVADKSQALEYCAHFIGANLPSVNASTLLQSLIARERLGSTGLGNGIAIPHCRLKNLDAVIGALITLTEPIDFEAIDNKPVDILFVLLAPEQALQEHLNTLATLAKVFNQAAFRQQLRAADSATQLYQTALEFGSH